MEEIIVTVIKMYFAEEDYKSYLQSQLPEVQNEFYKIVEGWGKDADKCINKECS